MCHCIDGHFPAHHVHRSFRHETAGKHQGVDAESLQFAGHREAILNLESSLESVAHVGLDQYPHVITCRLHDFVDAHTHEVHAPLERPPELIASPVGIRGEKLRDKVTMSCM